MSIYKIVKYGDPVLRQKTKEITAKEKKFDNKIRTLETEHEALTKEYESVENALNANISRSFKTFNT